MWSQSLDMLFTSYGTLRGSLNLPRVCRPSAQSPILAPSALPAPRDSPEQWELVVFMLHKHSTTVLLLDLQTKGDTH